MRRSDHVPLVRHCGVGVFDTFDISKQVVEVAVKMSPSNLVNNQDLKSQH